MSDGTRTRASLLAQADRTGDWPPGCTVPTGPSASFRTAKPRPESAFGRAWDAVFGAEAQARLKAAQDRDDDRMLQAARGGPFWGEGKPNVGPGDLVGLADAMPLTERPSLEKYVRVTIEFGSYLYEPAVEWRDGDGFYEMVEALEGCALAASFDSVPLVNPPTDPMKQAKRAGAVIAASWPGRAYFVEVWQGARRGFAQVFQPYGVPRNRTGVEMNTESANTAASATLAFAARPEDIARIAELEARVEQATGIADRALVGQARLRAIIDECIGVFRAAGIDTSAETLARHFAEVAHERTSARMEIEKLRGRTNEASSCTLAELQREAARTNERDGVIAFLVGSLARIHNTQTVEAAHAIATVAQRRIAEWHTGSWRPNPADDPVDWQPSVRQASGLGWPTKAEAEAASMVSSAHALEDGTYAAAVSASGYLPDEAILRSGRRVNVQPSNACPGAWCIVEVAAKRPTHWLVRAMRAIACGADRSKCSFTTDHERADCDACVEQARKYYEPAGDRIEKSPSRTNRPDEPDRDIKPVNEVENGTTASAPDKGDQRIRTVDVGPPCYGREDRGPAAKASLKAAPRDGWVESPDLEPWGRFLDRLPPLESLRRRVDAIEIALTGLLNTP